MNNILPLTLAVFLGQLACWAVVRTLQKIENRTERRKAAEFNDRIVESLMRARIKPETDEIVQ